jgi:hypothetical protein
MGTGARPYGERGPQSARDSQAAHDWQATRLLPFGKRTNAGLFSTGASDGGYPLYFGLDAHGRAGRFVLDFGLIRLERPRESQ